MDERMCRIAATVFTDVHHGTAITKEESDYHDKLLEVYKQEIAEAKKIVKEDSNFESLSYNEQIEFVVELLDKLRIKNHGYEEIDIQLDDRPKEKFADINDLMDTIPQEPYQEISSKK